MVKPPQMPPRDHLQLYPDARQLGKVPVTALIVAVPVIGEPGHPPV